MQSDDNSNSFDDHDSGPEGEIGSLFLNDITKLDCALFDLGTGISGSSWHVDVTLSGILDANGFVYDFSLLKNLVRQTLKTSVDHALVIPVGSQSVQYTEIPNGEHWTLESRSKVGSAPIKWEYTCPKGAVYPIRCLSLTPSVIEQELGRLLKHRLPGTITDIRVKLRSEVISPTEAVFRYTHGIAGHQGLCQRLFHGHRSRIEIYVGEDRRADLEHFVVGEIFAATVHFATPEQLKNTAPWPLSTRGPAGQTVSLDFKGTLGQYSANLPADHVFLVDQETSIECVSRSIAQAVRKKLPKAEVIRAVCYEGIGKGGVGFA